MKTYKVIYKARGSKTNDVFETMLTADNIKEARKWSKIDLGKDYVIVKIKLEK